MITATKSRRRVSPPTASPAPLPPLPVTTAGRAAAYADAVMAAVLTLQAQLRDPDTAVSHAAAVAIVDLEKTRMRHDTPVAGTHAPSELLEPLPELPPLSHNTAPGGRGQDREPETWDDFVDDVWDQMQEEADQDGRCEIISQEQAEACARRIHAEATAGRGSAAGIPHPTPPPHPVK